MRSFTTLAVGLAFASLGLAAPTDQSLARSSFDNSLLSVRAISPDNSCGATSVGNYSCDSTTSGPCCSGGGWCGSTSGMFRVSLYIYFIDMAADF